MFTKGKKSGTIRFYFRSPGIAQKVLVAGTFSQWKPRAMKRQKDGRFALTVTAPAGTHEYRFIVDGDWTADPDNDSYVLNPCGSVNSVAQAA